MFITRRLRYILTFAFFLLLPARMVSGDTGPKPTMTFTFKSESAGDQVTITSGTMYECRQSDCSDAAALQELGPQRFACDALSCEALAYGFAPYHKLQIQFSDGKTRESNIFATAGFASAYTVTIRPDDLLVESQFTARNMFPRVVTLALLCLCLLVIGGLVLGAIILLMRRRAKN